VTVSMRVMSAGDGCQCLLRTVTASADDEPETKRRRAVAGYDFTFSIPRSARVLCGVTDAAT